MITRNSPVFIVVVLLCFGGIDVLNATPNSELDELRKELNEIKATCAVADEVKSLRAEIEKLKQEKQDSKQNSKRLLISNPYAEKPAFSASLTSHAINLGQYQTIVFDNVFTNDLGAYSPVTGVFTAPMNGTYFFTATVMSHSGKYLESEICRDGHSLVFIYSYDSSFEQGSNSVILALTAGEKVWVRHHASEGSDAYGGHWSAFSGFML